MGTDSHILDPANLKDNFPELVDICTLNLKIEFTSTSCIIPMDAGVRISEMISGMLLALLIILCKRNQKTRRRTTRNQRIERLWHEVFRYVSFLFYCFYSLEASGYLDLNDPIHLFVLHYVFAPRTNYALNEFKLASNLKPVGTEHNWKPSENVDQWYGRT